jgi:nicotinamide phosphoribosyltransferase
MRKLKLSLNNLIYTLDSYKQLHAPMYVKGTTKVAAYGEARSGSEYENIVFFGLQYHLIRWLEGVAITTKMIDEAEPYLQEHFKFNGCGVWNRDKWDYIVKNCGGKLPVKICAVPEGLKIPKNNILFRIINTDDNCWWLSNSLETILQQVWYPCAVATRSNFIISKIREAFQKSVDDDSQWMIDFMLHDFGQRATTCMEQAGIGGMAHLVNSKGTDTDMAIPFAVNYYNAKKENLCYSVPADEHSIATSKGKEGEYEIAQTLCQLFPTGILSKVSDSFGIENAVNEYCFGKTKDFILARDGKFVVRPDSKRWKGDKPCEQVLWIAQKLEAGFGSSINKKGFKTLNPKVGIIYGDGLSEFEIIECVNVLTANGFTASTCVFGQGGGLLQKLNRDTLDFAIKCCAQVRDGKTYDIFKQPQGGTKVSKRGMLKLVKDGDTYITVNESDPRPDILETVFENGILTKEYTFEEIRANSIR